MSASAVSEPVAEVQQSQNQVDGTATVQFRVDPMVNDASTIRVNATFQIEGTSSFDAFVDGGDDRTVTIHSSNGISVTRIDGGRALKFAWDGRTEQPWVNYTIERSQEYRQGRFANRIGPFIDGGDWMYLNGPNLVSHGPPDVTVQSTRTIETDEPVVRGNGLTFIGEHTEAVREGGGTEFRVVVPASAQLSPTPDDIAGMLANVSADLPTDPPTETTYVFVSTGDKEVSQEVGGDVSIDDKWDLVGYTERSRAFGTAPARNTWIHEYFHARQTYPPLAERIAWFDEGSADYYMMLYSARQGLLDGDTYLRNLRNGDGGTGERFMDDTLSDRSTWDDGTSTEYEKGRRVLAALDAKIRNDTGGNRTLLDVYERMAGRASDEQRLDYAEFKHIVESVAGESYDTWLDRYTTTSAVPAVPEEAASYATGTNTIPDETEPAAEPTTTTTEPTPAETTERVPEGTVTNDGGASPGFGIVTGLATIFTIGAWLRRRH